MEKKYILQLSTFPAVKVGTSNDGLTQYRKELIKVGEYTNDGVGAKYNVSLDILHHWAKTFKRWRDNGNKVSIPPGHDNENPADNQGWVTDMFVEDNSLYGILELLRPELSLVTDVSISWRDKIIDGKGIKYDFPIVHVALTTLPVVGGLKDFEKLSLVIGDSSMKFIETIAKKLGMKDKAPTEESVMLAMDELVKEPDNKVELSVVTNPLVKLVSENRAMKLSGLVKAGLITPAVKDMITAKLVDQKVLALSMSEGKEDGFDLLYEVLVQNRPAKLDEITGVQSLELSSKQDVQPNVMQREVAKRRAAFGLKS